MQAMKLVHENLCDETLRAVIQHPDALASNQILEMIDKKPAEMQIALVDLIVNVLETF
jgi:hypothetical protein